MDHQRIEAANRKNKPRKSSTVSPVFLLAEGHASVANPTRLHNLLAVTGCKGPLRQRIAEGQDSSGVGSANPRLWAPGAASSVWGVPTTLSSDGDVSQPDQPKRPCGNHHPSFLLSKFPALCHSQQCAPRTGRRDAVRLTACNRRRFATLTGCKARHEKLNFIFAWAVANDTLSWLMTENGARERWGCAATALPSNQFC